MCGCEASALRRITSKAVLEPMYADQPTGAGANERLDRWTAWAQVLPDDPSQEDSVLEWLRYTLHHDLDTPAALQAVDAFVDRAPADDESIDAIDALLGVRLR